MSEGIIFYNDGTKCLSRLLVSVHSLRKYYNGNICIISSGEKGREIVQKVCKEYECQFKEMVSDINNIKYHYFFEKTRMHLYTPYDITFFMDSDTLTIKNPSDIFSSIEENDFVVPMFSNWTTQTDDIKNRLSQWRIIDNNLVEETINKNRPSVNVGTYGFKKSSEFMKNWFDFTMKNIETFIPDEIACHLLLNRYKGIIVDRKYNCSCKYDDPFIEDTRIVHYHGRKHCRITDGKIMYHGELWVKEWKEVFEKNVCDVKEWGKTSGDRYLRRYVW